MRDLIHLLLSLVLHAGDPSTTAELPEVGAELAPEDLLFQDVPVVISSTRTEKSLLDVPNAVTVITAEEIDASGATSLGELLQWVPGLEIMRNSVTDTNVSLRGFNNTAASNVLVMIDGRTSYEDFFGIVLWERLNVTLADIERIEVIRGPGSALYGANAFLGTVNIITRKPRDLPTSHVVLGAGPTGALVSATGARSSARAALKGSVEYRTQEHFRNDTAAGEQGTHRRGDTGLRAFKANSTLVLAIDDGAELRFRGGLARLSGDLQTSIGTFHYLGPRYDAEVELEVGRWKLQSFLTRLDLDVDTLPLTSTLVPTATPIPIRDRIESTTVDFELQRELSIGSHDLLLGMNTRRLVTSSPVILGSREEETHYAAFLQDEYSIRDWLTAYVGARLDRHPKTGNSVSPRVSLVGKLGETSRLRISYASSFRNPTQILNYISLQTHSPPPIPILLSGNEDLDPTWVTAYEIGFERYVGSRLRVSADLFYNVIDDFQVFGVVGSGLSWTNQDRTVNRGGELSLEFRLWDSVRGFATYSFQSAHGRNEYVTPRHKASAGVRGRLGSRVRYALSGSLVGHTRTEVNATAGLPNRTIHARFMLDAFLGVRLHPRLELGFHARNLTHQVHRHYPLGDEIGSQLLATATWEF